MGAGLFKYCQDDSRGGAKSICGPFIDAVCDGDQDSDRTEDSTVENKSCESQGGVSSECEDGCMVFGGDMPQGWLESSLTDIEVSDEQLRSSLEHMPLDQENSEEILEIERSISKKDALNSDAFLDQEKNTSEKRVESLDISDTDAIIKSMEAKSLVNQKKTPFSSDFALDVSGEFEYFDE
mmetsp:Transcript_11836/g.20577  ORF Transcript_11836/g.20577 Transcript_11836/m.20577 type:complete len:181 (-) Transcript_11836:235-777(-)|eukprot:CAMPEP_0183730092 /NCGR_PEP_ID=MMETSP0737-20130205/31951_1 /TAXON_ID=385413 /ORGANISM="Thalassiosira miniscula, Strain CCMP1093" /LENGTH=180 /DNA_ID=CAMNT_0025962481 /DNA_START=165 /DNA_END=707 /DNA_ORIENTATION=+